MNGGTQIAILGWGSLLWGGGKEFDALHAPWLSEGPMLKVEFSRVSKSRLGALTLVIDPDNGFPTTIAYCLSQRHEIEPAIEDLRIREGAGKGGIGHFRANGPNQFRDKPTFEAIAAWANTKALDGVVWTDLRPNFVKKIGKSFSVENALDYLARLEGEAKIKAEEYFKKAPAFVQTPLRKAWNEEHGIDLTY
jgi:hypothetical protein